MKLQASPPTPRGVGEDQVIHFEWGLPGYPACTRFVLSAREESVPLQWLRCLDRPEVAFLVAAPERVVPGCELDVPPEALSVVGWKDSDDPANICALLILSVEDGQLTANLCAPVIVNLQNWRGYQALLDGPSSALRHPLGDGPVEGD
jgi:flagellar assembly factor FliW